ncbi:MAG: DUF378 domain-containing protein [Parcubacteria group bacterium]|nr:DUF378 domain-containing protein [Parcubacteria group bacterium]
MKFLHKVTFLLLVIGGLNWGALALFGWDIGSLFGGQMALTSKAIYILVGLSAIYEAATHFKNCKECMSGSSTM